MRALYCALFVVLSLLAATETRATSTECQVVIAGGSTAALAAALSASKFVQTCLVSAAQWNGEHIWISKLEPTDWVGGQFTSSGLPAPDFAWHTVKNPATNVTENVAEIDRSKANVTPNLYRVLQTIGDPGKCWVSPHCGTSRQYLQQFQALVAEAGPNLQIFYNAVLKNVTTRKVPGGEVIVSLRVIQRTARNETKCGGYNRFLSEDLPDWYNANDSPRYTKQVLEFKSRDSTLVFMDATEWGELLALSDAPYLQGIAEKFDGDTSGEGNDTCGQSSTFAVSAKLFPNMVSEPANPYPDQWSAHYFSLTGHSWDSVWTYRRMTAATTDWQHATIDDITLQNWNPGNDNAFQYLFLSRNVTRQQRADWQGGVSVKSLQTAEYMAYAWHYWFKSQAPSDKLGKIKMMTDQFGTCHGLSKVPYIRDTRRSIGLDDFVMKVIEISGLPEQRVGYRYPDSLALGAYPVDVHGLAGCHYPDYMHPGRYQVLPFFIPLRAMTNKRYSNLLVAGKTMATSFLVNAGARLHPIEWSTGTAAGVSAALMAELNLDSTAVLLRNYLPKLQQASAQFTPNCWTIQGQCY